MRPSFSHSAVLTTFLFSIASLVAALGINCRGSAMCDLGGNNGATLSQLIKRVEEMPAHFSWGPGEHIVCVSHLCAFTQNWDKYIDQPLALEKLRDLS